MDPFTILMVAGAALGAILVVRITWKIIRKWMEKILGQKTWLFWKKNRALYLVKERLRNGNYRVIGGVFNRSLELTASEKWEGAELDNALINQFDGQDKIYIQQW
jgi:hypothetical protein